MRMSFGGHSLVDQRQKIEDSIKFLVNNDLKELCRAYDKPVSGTKAVLQERCKAALSEIILDGDHAALDEFRYRLQNHGRAPHNPPPFSQYGPPSGHQQPSQQNHHNYSSNTGTARKTSTANRLPSIGRSFKSSPFYEIKEKLLPLQDLQEMPQNRHTVRTQLAIASDTAQQLRNDSGLKIMLYCGVSQGMASHGGVDVAFPNQIEVKINNQDVRANFKGLKNKPGSTKPTDITAFIRKYNGQQNAIQITYALTNKRYAFTVYLVRYVSPDKLTEIIKSRGAIPKHQVMTELSRANADPDIAATSIRMSLKDPISTMRISIPVRSVNCSHNQCFDGAFFMQLQDQAPQWSCPVCSKGIPFETLCVDKYFEDILQNTSKSIEKVDIEPDGQWKVIKEEEDSGHANGMSSRDQRASYDDDDDDDDEDEDLVELDTPPTNRQVNGIRSSIPTPSFPPPDFGRNFTIDTPSVASREASTAPTTTSSTQRRGEKRPSGAIIDLTASDDEQEEQPPRVAKRQQTSNFSQGNRTNSYSTPASLPDPRYSSSNNITHTNMRVQADSFRRGSNHSGSTYGGTTHTPSIPSPALPYGSQSPLITSSSNQRGSPFCPSNLDQHAWTNPASNPDIFAPPSPFSVRRPSHHRFPFGGGGGDAHGHSHNSSIGSSSTNTTTNPASIPDSSLRLPPIRHNTNGTWRADYNAFSQSPPGR